MTTTATAESSEKPFVGLVPFTETDAVYFFGRAADRAVIASNLVAAKLTVLYGPSGCGKSSLLDAGVAHEINRVRAPRQIAAGRAPEYVAVTFRSWRDDPRLGLLARVREAVESVLGHPVEQPPDDLYLADVLGAWAQRLGGTLLIVLDQFEEYFQYHGRRVVEGTFARELARTVCEPNLRANFLISLREDSLAQLDVFEGHIAGLLANTLRLDRLDRDRGRETIAGPIERYNELYAKNGRAMAIEPGLIDAVLEAVEAGAITLETAGRATIEDQTGQDDSDRPIETAYLQLVMTRLWEAEAEAGSRVLRLETFHHLGGAKKIVGTHLDTVMATFEEHQREVAAELFRYLVTPTGTKFALTLNELAYYTTLPTEEIQPVLIQLDQQVRILRKVSAPNDDPAKSRYEIFHDVLAAVIVDWRRRYMNEQAKIEESRAAETRRREEAKAAEANRREKAKAAEAKRREFLLRSGSVVLLLLTGLTAFAIYSWRQSEDEKKLADQAAKISQSSVLAAQAASVLDSDPDQSLALAVAAFEKERTAAAERALRLSLAGSHVRAVLANHRGKLVSVAYSPDGLQLAMASNDGRAEVWDTATRALNRSFDNVAFNSRSLVMLAFGGAGRYLTTVDAGGVVAVHDLSSGARPQKLAPPGGRNHWAASFSRDGSRVCVATDDKVIRVWELPSGNALGERKVQDARITHLAFSGDGNTLAAVSGPEPEPEAPAPTAAVSSQAPTAGQKSTVRVWEVGTDNPVLTVEEPAVVTALALSSDGRRLATATGAQTGPVKVWDLAPGKPVPTSPTWTTYHSGEVSDVSFNTTETILAIATTNGRAQLNGTAQLWDLRTKLFRGVMNCQAPITHVTFSTDGERLLLRCEDKTAMIWPIGTNESIALRGHTGAVLDAVFSPDGRTVATASADGTARVWDVFPGPRPIMLSGPLAPWSDAVFSPDSQRVITACVDNVVRVWDAATGKSVLELPAHFAPVASTAISSDGGRLATAGTDRIARVWDASSGNLLQTFRGHEAPLTAVAFSPAVGQLATASHDGTARLWDLNSGQTRGVLSGHQAPVTGLAFRRDGSRLATAGLDNTIRVWDTAACSEVSKRPGYSASIVSGVFSPDGRLITASMGVGKSKGPGARIVDVATGRTLELDGHSGTVTGAAFSPDGETVATSGHDRTVRLWDAAAGRARAVLYGHNSRVIKILFSPKCSFLASQALDTTGIIWDAGKSLELFRLPGLTSTSSMLVFNPQGTMLATVDAKFNAHLWDVASGKVAQTLEGHSDFIRGFAFSPDGLLAATASQDGTLRLWDVKTGESKKKIVTPSYGGLSMNLVEFSRDGRQLVTAGTDGMARIWDVHCDSTQPRPIAVGVAQAALALSSDGKLLAIGCLDGSVRLVDMTATKILDRTPGWMGTTLYIPVFSPDGTRLVTPGQGGTAQVWDTKTGSVIRVLKGPSRAGDVNAAKFSPDGRRLATSSIGGGLQLWDMETNGPPRVIATNKLLAFELLAFDPAGTRLAAASGSGNTALTWNCTTGAPIAELKGHGSGLTSLTFSPEGKHLATSSYDITVRIWDAETGNPGPVLHPGAFVNHLSFSPDGTRLATAGMGIGGRVWDVKTGKPIDLPLKTEGVVRCLSFSPDGKRLVSAGDEKALRVWDVTTGQPLTPLRGSQFSVYHLSFSPDGKHIVAAGYSDRSARVWEVETGKPLPELPHGSTVSSAAYSADGAFIVTTAADNTAKVWDAGTGKLLSALGNRMGAAVKNLAFSNGDSSIITAHVDGKVGVWEVQTGRLTTVLDSGGSPVNAASFSPDRRRVVTVSGKEIQDLSGQQPRARIWKENESEPELDLSDRLVAVSEAWFSPDGMRAITLRRDGSVKVWDASTGKPLAVLGVASFSPTDSAFPDAAMSPNGKFIAITSRDGRVRVWDLVTGKPLTSLTGPGGLVLAVAFSPDSTTVLAAYADGTARLFVIDCLRPVDQLYERALGVVRMLNRELTPEDLRKYLDEPLVK